MNEIHLTRPGSLKNPAYEIYSVNLYVLFFKALSLDLVLIFTLVDTLDLCEAIPDGVLCLTESWENNFLVH